MLFPMLLMQVTGINLITFYSPVLFQTLGFGHNASLYSAVILGIISIGCTTIAAFVMDKFGRRILFCCGGITMFLFLVSIDNYKENSWFIEIHQTRSMFVEYPVFIFHMKNVCIP